MTEFIEFSLSKRKMIWSFCLSIVGVESWFVLLVSSLDNDYLDFFHLRDLFVEFPYIVFESKLTISLFKFLLLMFIFFLAFSN